MLPLTIISYLLTWVMFGANTIATFRAFILLKFSNWATSAIRLIAQSSKAASVNGRSLTSWAHSSSDCACITCSAERESNTPFGSSLNQAYRKTPTFPSWLEFQTNCSITIQHNDGKGISFNWQFSSIFCKSSCNQVWGEFHLNHTCLKFKLSKQGTLLVTNV